LRHNFGATLFMSLCRSGVHFTVSCLSIRCVVTVDIVEKGISLAFALNSKFATLVKIVKLFSRILVELPRCVTC